MPCKKKTTTKTAPKRHRRGFYVVKKGNKYIVMHQPTAGKPTVSGTYSTKKGADDFVRKVKGASKKVAWLMWA